MLFWIQQNELISNLWFYALNKLKSKVGMFICQQKKNDEIWIGRPLLGILLLAHLDLLAENLSYLLLGLLLLLVAYLILVKILFFSNLIPKNTTDINLGKKYGTASGIGSLVIGIILIILGLFL